MNGLEYTYTHTFEEAMRALVDGAAVRAEGTQCWYELRIGQLCYWFYSNGEWRYASGDSLLRPNKLYAIAEATEDGPVWEEPEEPEERDRDIVSFAVERDASGSQVFYSPEGRRRVSDARFYVSEQGNLRFRDFQVQMPDGERDHVHCWPVWFSKDGLLEYHPVFPESPYYRPCTMVAVRFVRLREDEL